MRVGNWNFMDSCFFVALSQRELYICSDSTGFWVVKVKDTQNIILLFDRNSFHNFNLNFAIKKKKKIPAFRQFLSSNSSALILLKTKNNKSTVHVS